MSIFTSERVSEHLTRIITPCGVCLYLVQGRDRAALLDTGFGFGDLKSYLESLIHTPYTVLLSHGHLDHAGGAGQFDEVFLHPADWELERWHCTLQRRIDDVRNGPGGMPPQITEADFLPSRTAPYTPLLPGQDFDLGGVTVQVLPAAGHTAGSVIFLIPEDRIAIFGDACGEHTLLLFRESTSIETYHRNLCALRTAAPAFDRVLRNHGSYESPKQILEDNIALCEDILARRDAALPADFHGSCGLLGRPEQHPGFVGNIVYDPAKLLDSEVAKS